MSFTHGPNPMDVGTLQPFLDFMTHARWVVITRRQEFVERFRPAGWVDRSHVGAPEFVAEGVSVAFYEPGTDNWARVFIEWPNFLQFYRIHQ